MTFELKWVALAATAALLAGVAVVAGNELAGGLSGWFASGGSGAATTGAGERAMAQPQAQPRKPAPTAPPQAPAAQRRTETINYDNWVVTCTETVEKGSPRVCSGMLRIVDSKTGQGLFAWIIGRDNEGVLRTVFQTPTGVQIQKGVELKFGKSGPGVVPYTACTRQQCEASIVMGDGMIREARGNEQATATIHAIGGRAINFEMGIKGIDKVFAALGAK